MTDNTRGGKLTLDLAAPLPTLQELKDRVEAVLREREIDADEPLVSAFVVLLALLHAVSNGVRDGERNDIEASLADHLGGKKLLIHTPGSTFEMYVGSDRQPTAPYQIHSRVINSLLEQNLLNLFFHYVRMVRSSARLPIWCNIVEVARPKSSKVKSTLCRWQDEAFAAGLIETLPRRGRAGGSAPEPRTMDSDLPQAPKTEVRPPVLKRRRTTEIWLRHTAPADVLPQLDGVLRSGVYPRLSKDTRAALAAALLAAYAWENRASPAEVELVEQSVVKLLGEERHLWIEISPKDRELRLVLANSQAWPSTVSLEIGGPLVSDILHPSTRCLLASLAYAADRMADELIPTHVHGPTDRVRRLNRLRLFKLYLARPLES